jgi:hypothetical protein
MMADFMAHNELWFNAIAGLQEADFDTLPMPQTQNLSLALGLILFKRQHMPNSLRYFARLLQSGSELCSRLLAK